MDLSCKSATYFSLAQLAQIMNLAFTNYVGGEINLTTEVFAGFIHQNHINLNLSQVVLQGGIPIGLGLIARQGWTNRLASMGIVPSHTGQGVGTWLMNQLIQQARDRQDQLFVLEVIEQNPPGVKLYQKIGFQTTERLVGYSFTTESDSADLVETLQTINSYEVAQQLFQHAPQIPWQLGGTTVATFGPPNYAYRLGPAYIVISDPTQETIIIRTLVVETNQRNQGWATCLLKAVLAQHPNKTWKIPAIYPEPVAGNLFEQLGFVQEKVSQFAMQLTL